MVIHYSEGMNSISPRLLEVASRLSGKTPEQLRAAVAESNFLQQPASELGLGDLLADRAEVVLYSYTDPIRSMAGLNPREREANRSLHQHPEEVRREGFPMIYDLESKIPGGPSVYTVFEGEPGLVEVNYRQPDQFLRLFIDTTPGHPGEQWLVTDATPLIRQAFGTK
jgi:hypothetical protein